MRYDPVYNIFVRDARDKRYETENDDALDERGIIKDGKSVRVGLMMMDSGSVQQSIALEDAARRREEARDWQKAELSSRWKGGLAEGDHVPIGDKLMVVSGRNPSNGKVQLRDAEGPAAPGRNVVKQRMYDEYDADIQRSWMQTRDAQAGGACTTAGRQSGTWRNKGGRLVCVPDDKSSKSPEEQEWAIAGPLSDAERVKIKDEMYASYDRSISEAWRR
jgi:hypothetical protein